jgi:hypothetical protein
MAKRLSKSKKVTPPRGGEKSKPKGGKKPPSPKHVGVVDPFPGGDPFKLKK